MNRHTIIKLFGISLFVSFFFFNVGSLRCAAMPEALTNAQSQDRFANKKAEESDQDWRENKSARFKVLEWLIMQNLLAKYHKMEKDEDQYDILD